MNSRTMNEKNNREYMCARRSRVKANRRRAAIRKLSFSCMTGLFIMVIALSVFSMTAKADTNANANKYKYYESHLIEQGESLWSIAEANMDEDYYDSIQDYIEEIKEVNGFSKDKLQSGNYILIPYYSEEARVNS